MDRTDFERLYLDMLPGLYRLAQSILRNPADAQDAVQQAAVKAWLALDRLPAGGERAYFTRIVINECRNIQRQRMKVMTTAELPERGLPPKDRELAQAVAKLPEALRLPLLMKYMEGYSEREISAALGIGVPAVKSRLYRARRRLERALKEEVELG